MICPLLAIDQVDEVLPNGSDGFSPQSVCRQFIPAKLVLVKAASGNPDLLDRCLDEIQSASFGGVV